MEIPNWFEYQTMGSSLISFDVPADFHLDQLQVTVWADYSLGKLSNLARRFNMHIRNLTNDDELNFSLWGSTFEEGSWVRHISPNFPIKSGDRIEVYFEVKDRNVIGAEKIETDMKVGKFGVHMEKKKLSKHDFKLATQTKRRKPQRH